MTEHCLHESDFGRIRELVESHERDINGNGKKGLRDEVTVLSTKIEGLNTSVQDLATNVSALVRFENEFKGAEKANRYNLNKYLQIAAIIISIIGGFIMWNNRMNKLEAQVGLINTPVKTRNGEIVLYPSGVVVDSLSKDSQWNEKK